MQNLRHLAVPAYLVSTLLVLIPLLDASLSVLPSKFGEVSWRFGSVGLFSRALMTPLLGLLLAYGVALLLEHRRTVRVLSVLSGLLATLLMVVLVLFTLDAVQVRAQVRPEARLAFDVATLTALGKYALGGIVATAFAISGWKASRRGRVSARTQLRERSGASPLPVGGQEIRS